MLFAQNGTALEQPNLVPNPGFENFSILPSGWFYKGDDFTALIRDWSSPTEASPDLYNAEIQVPDTWQQKGFGRQHPRSGKTMAGITVFGCNEGKPHCREYIHVNLGEPLVQGQVYYVEFWAMPLETGMLVNNIGMYFSMDKMRERTDREVRKLPQVVSDRVVGNQLAGWTKISGEITANFPYRFITIGNFNTDENTINNRKKVDGQPFGYYYIDDVTVRKRPPIIQVPDDDLADWYPIEENKTIRLNEVLFDHDKHTIRPDARQELQKLLKFLKEYPSMEIEVTGHTDDTGGFDYNMRLSTKRARAVVRFLLDQEVEQDRLSYLGFGNTRPITSNQTSSGRQKNRRVEFRIRKI
ncbi:MAG: OmpA family protein [Saprospiraceae bacterium]|nr:OmpA family protein [Saprospiraceae bacterium]